MIALANREDEYEQEDLESLEALGPGHRGIICLQTG